MFTELCNIVFFLQNTHGSGRGGFGGQRGSMRAGGGTRGLNRGTPRGASHRGAANTPIVQSTRQ